LKKKTHANSTKERETKKKLKKIPLPDYFSFKIMAILFFIF